MQLLEMDVERRSLGRPVSRRGARQGLPVASLSMSVAAPAGGNVLCTISAAKGQPPPPAVTAERPSLNRLILRNPLAILGLVPKELYMFMAGGVAGAIAKTTTAPLDRVRPLASQPSAAGCWLHVVGCAAPGRPASCLLATATIAGKNHHAGLRGEPAIGSGAGRS